MAKKFICLTFTLLVLGATGAAYADLVARYRLDEGQGNVVTDSSGNGYHGDFVGVATWADGVNGGAVDLSGAGDYIDLHGPTDWPSGREDRSMCAWALTRSVTDGFAWIFTYGTNATSHAMFIGQNGATLIGAGFADATTVANWWVVDEWHHIALAYDGAQSYLYADGALVASQPEDWDLQLNQAHIGEQVGNLGEYWNGLIDDVRLYNHVLSQAEVAEIMVSDYGQALTPAPRDGAVDVPRDVVLGWTAGPEAVTHDVYFGTNQSDLALVSQGQTDVTYAPEGRLEFETTYSWRVDEIGATADQTHEGTAWQFTTEPFVYTVEGITATSNATSPASQGPENTVNGSGLDADNEHSMAMEDMWLGSPAGDDPVYIQYDLGRTYKLYEMFVWNYNIQFEAALGYGLKDVTIEYSTSGADWTVLDDIELAQGISRVGYAANTTVSFDGVAAQYVRLTANSTWASTEFYGLSEVRFTYIPAHARMPEPADGATDVPVETPLAWRPGREATSHEVSLSTDPNDCAVSQTVSDNRFAPEDLQLGATYYWQVEEVNEAETIASWFSDRWIFSTEAYIVVEDFEAYTDDYLADRAIWQRWIDGIDNSPNGGSQVGHDPSPFAELTIVHGGHQAMPLIYSNLGFSFAEADYAFDTPQDWTAHGVKSLSLYIYGRASNTGQPYVKINETKVTDEFMATALTKPQWTAWTIDLTALDAATVTQVRTLSIGIEGAGASGTVLVDDVRLYGQAAEVIEPVVPGHDDPNLAAYYNFDGNTNDSTGTYPGTPEADVDYTDGLFGQALLLNGVNSGVIHSFAAEEVWPAYSLSLWARTDEFAQVVYSSLFNNNSSSSDFQLDVDGGNPGRYRYRGSATRFFGPVVTEWVHLGITCDGTQTLLYFNGLAVDSAQVADTRFGQIAVGINRAGAERFEGTIDEVRLYDRPLTAGEMAGLAGITAAIPKPF